MTTLTYGFQRPDTGDKGSVWFPAMEDNITQLDSHNHDGVNSAALPSSSIGKFSSTISSGSWVSDGGGNYHVVVTVPIGISGASTYNDIIYYEMIVKINTAGVTYGDRLYPSLERESSTTFTVRVNNNTLDLIIYYV